MATKSFTLPLAQAQQVEVEVEKLVAGGEGLARFSGIPIFVPDSAPGDRLKVQLVERHADYARGRIVEIQRAGGGRRTPPCPYYGRCGGCNLQHIEDALQVELKSQALLETLQRIAGIDYPEPPEILHAESWGYRLRTQLRTRQDQGQCSVGFLARGSHELVAVDHCPILAPELADVLPTLPRVLADRAPQRLDLAVGDGPAWTCAPLVADLPRGEVKLKVGSYSYSFDARCFFQAHRGLLAQLVEAVVGKDTGAEAYDLYAGVGLFTLPLAASYRKVVAVEGDRIAARYAHKNLRRCRGADYEVIAQAVETWIRRLPRHVDRVVVDPPRNGLPPVVRRILLQRLPRRLTYVSCHAATLARDLKELVTSYRVERVILADLFPQTGHMEAVVHLIVT